MKTRSSFPLLPVSSVRAVILMALAVGLVLETPVVHAAEANSVASEMSAAGMEPAPTQPPAPVREVSLPMPAAVAQQPADDTPPEPRIIRGNDRMIAEQPSAQPPEITGAGASLRFEQAPIAEVVHAVFGDILKLDYVIHPPVSGTITLSTQAPIPPDQVLLVLESVLQANGIAMVADSRGLYHIGTPEALKGIVPPPRVAASGRRLAPGAGTVIVPLKYIGAAEMAEILRPVATPEAFVRVDTLRNLLVLSGGRAQIEGWLELVNTFDIDILSGMSVGVFPLRYASVREVQAALELMTTGSGASAAHRDTGLAGQLAAASSPSAGEGARAQSGAPLHALFGAVRILPIERLNSILVVTPRASYLDQARIWIERLDQPSDSGTEAQLYVYRVQNGSAAHLATVLNGIFGGSATSADGPESSVAPGLKRSQATSAARTGLKGLGGASTGALPQIDADAGQSQGGQVIQATFETGVRVIADEFNNAILIYGPRSEYRKIETALRKLDVAPTQILIEASIVEVTLKDELSYGLQWYFQDSTRRGLSGAGGLNLNATGNIGPQQPGFSYTLTGPLGDVRAVLNALADKSLVRVISSPSLMVLDNHTAAIQVGDQQPIQSAETITDGGVRSVSIEYKDTGVSLSVTPSVNAGDVVTMRILQSVTEVGPVDSATQQRSFQHRQIGSRVAVRSGDSIVLGGLIRDNTSRSKSGVPILHELPLVGTLFGATTVDSGRTELLVVVTPRVVRSTQDAREVSDELRERMRALRGFDARPQEGQAKAEPTVAD